MSKNKRPNGATRIFEEFINIGANANDTRVNLQNNQNQLRLFTIEKMYLRIIQELAMNRFKWEGLPKSRSVSPRYIEKCLFERQGPVVFYFDKRFNEFFALPGSGNGQFDMIGNPLSFNVVAANGNFVPTISANVGVPIWPNALRMPEWDTVSVFANRLANLERTIEINSSQARVQKILVSSEETRLTMMNISQQMDEGAPAIHVNTQMGETIEDIVKVLDMQYDPKHLEILDIVATRQWNKCMSLLGINNANQDKKERLVADEVDANNDQVETMRAVSLNARKEAAKQINDRYGFDIQVSYNTDVDAQAASFAPGPWAGYGFEAIGAK